MQSLLSLILAVAITAIASYYDIKTRQIPDWIWALTVVLAIAIWQKNLLKNGNLMVAALIFICLFLLAYYKLLGGGDLKLISALALLVGGSITAAIAAGTLLQLGFAYWRMLRTGENMWRQQLPLMPFVLFGLVAVVIINLFTKYHFEGGSF
ncbi:peptidase A24A prepilin type IV [Caldicellulosiruptor kronotskyensis 2002]|uniref:Peptidase A24A prepilin type IV n=1 Tax=Caldicellulosiruptor kronotskyensis (strain DSM 18902 / VKM B-2412 / 2002) TaxID=632348 RepID=E4SET2_CALK2|nr:A24 family peptidase [Caldicellulosiruptor kronotskyensis]ADQ45569.1 peptidase A24A prepilin type IV [Caldicellulosiruptor kronotskyensis 2002]